MPEPDPVMIATLPLSLVSAAMIVLLVVLVTLFLAQASWKLWHVGAFFVSSHRVLLNKVQVLDKQYRFLT